MKTRDKSEELDAFVVTRLLQITAYSLDAQASGAVSAAAKKRSLGELVAATVGVARQVPDVIKASEVAAIGESRLAHEACGPLLEKMSAELPPDVKALAIIDFALATDWPSGTTWVADKWETLASASKHLDVATTAPELFQLWTAHRKARKRLQKDSTPVGMQATLGAVLLAAAAASGGISTAVGTAVGTHVLGYSGAAATSAGLALLGGGSLAVGGFGMAGGTWLVAAATKSAARQSMKLATRLASQSSAAMISELAKLDVTATHLPHRRSAIIGGLRLLETELADELARIRPADINARRWRMTKSALKTLSPVLTPTALKELKRDFPPADERNVAASARAVDYQIRHLTATEWERKAYAVPRLLGAPVVGKVLKRR